MNELIQKIDPENILRSVAGFAIMESATWDNWEWRSIGYETTVEGVGRITLVAKKEDERQRDDYYYGDYAQGSEDPISLTFKVDFSEEVTRFYQKKGYSNSYGSSVWVGDFLAVQPRVKNVTVYEVD